MPLFQHQIIGSDTLWGIWKCDEEESWFTSSFSFPASLLAVLSTHGSTHRRLEKLAAHALLYTLLRQDGILIDHLPSGKPFIEGYHISISHTAKYVAVMLSKHENVAIDIERISDRVLRVASRYMRTDERGDSLNDKLLIWSGKETLYKYYDCKDLLFQQIRLRLFPITSDRGKIEGENLLTNETLTMKYIIYPDFVLTYLCR